MWGGTRKSNRSKFQIREPKHRTEKKRERVRQQGYDKIFQGKYFSESFPNRKKKYHREINRSDAF